jgi:hypothetical protein
MTKKLAPDSLLNVGFGQCYLMKNNETIWQQEDNPDWSYCKDIEEIALQAPTARYLLVRDGAMWSEIYERFATGWVQIRRMFGFADDESAEAFQIELEKVMQSKTLSFVE